MQKKILILKFKNLRQVLYVYFHQTKDAEFIYDSQEKTFLSTLYIFQMEVHERTFETSGKHINNASIEKQKYHHRILTSRQTFDKSAPEYARVFQNGITIFFVELPLDVTSLGTVNDCN